MDHVLRFIEEIRTTAQEYRADLFIGIIPRYVQVYDEAWSKASFIYGLDDAKYSTLEPNRLFAERLEQRGFTRLDLLPALREEGEKRLLHFPIDGHWNVEGNDYVAGLLAAMILSASRSEDTPPDGVPGA